MVQVQIIHEFGVRAAGGARLATDELHAEGERLMQALLDLEKCDPDFTDSATATDADRGTVTVELLITAETETEALAKSLTIARTAIHTIGGATSAWDDPPDPTSEYQSRSHQLELV